MKQLFERLKKERERLGLNKSEFSNLAGISHRTYLNYENGKRVPDANFLAAIAEHGADTNNKQYERAHNFGRNEYRCPVTIRFDYRDHDGNITNRTVDVSTARTNDGGILFIRGHCRFRQDTRTFRVANMGNVIDAQTGEIVFNIERLLRAHQV